MNPICHEHGHDWSPTGLWVDGILRAPCRRKGCEAERSIREEVRETGFPSVVHGIPLDIEDDPQGGVAKIIMRELSLNQQINYLGLKPGDVVIDIGAHVGVVSIWLAKRYPGIKIHAYEPVETNWGCMIDNMLHNNLVSEGSKPDDWAIRPHNIAVTGDGRTVKLPIDLSSNSGGTSIYGGGWNAEQTVEVQSITLERIFKWNDIDRCALLKIDCEGAEYEILEAGEQYLDRIDWLMGEFHINTFLESQGKSIQALADMCARHIPQGHMVLQACRMGD